MAVVEVDEEELLRARKLQSTVAALMDDPDTKLMLQRAVKKKFPRAVTPELDAQEAATQSQSGMAKEFAEFKKAVADDKQAREDADRLRKFTESFEKGFDTYRAQGWQEAGIAEVRKLMEDKGIVDHAIAFAYYEKLHPPQDPISPSGHGAWNFVEQVNDDDKDLQQLLATKGESMPLVDKMWQTALTEFRGGSPRR